MSETKTPAPTVGRIVHYVADMGIMGLHMAAIVTRAYESGEGIDLCVFTPGSGQVNKGFVAEDPEGKKNGTWHWPEREG